MKLDPTMVAFGRHIGRRIRKNQPIRIPPMAGAQFKELLKYFRHRRIVGAYMTRHVAN